MSATTTIHTNDCVRQAAKFGARSRMGNLCSCGGDPLPEIIRRALIETVVDIGQLSKSEIYQLNKYVKKGWLSKGKGGPFPRMKTMYAHPSFDFVADREREIDHAMAICDLEERLRANGYFDTQSPNYGKPLPKEPRA